MLMWPNLMQTVNHRFWNNSSDTNALFPTSSCQQLLMGLFYPINVNIPQDEWACVSFNALQNLLVGTKIRAYVTKYCYDKLNSCHIGPPNDFFEKK